MTKIAGSGSISQRHGSADPDPQQNVRDPEHWFLGLPAPDLLVRGMPGPDKDPSILSHKGVEQTVIMLDSK
jgi:hypothetical protein